MEESKKKIKVLVVDDSAVVRTALVDVLNSDPCITVIDTAADPYIAVKKIANELPDVITLDMEMPRMNGLVFLKKLMAQHPIPVVVISSITGERTDIALKALEFGALNIITKPKLDSLESFEEYKITICDAVKSAASSKNSNKWRNEFLLKKKVLSNPFRKQPKICSKKLILIGASTGGTEVLSSIFKSLKNDLPPILVVQHMPGEFTRSFSDRLNSECNLVVKEAQDGEYLYSGHAYIANGFYHLSVRKLGNKYVCNVENGELVNRHRPSIDVLFHSVAKIAAQDTLAVLLTGMGVDGASGMLNIKNNGGICIAQDELSSVVFGMPKEAIKIGAANYVGSPDEISQWINKFRK